MPYKFYSSLLICSFLIELIIPFSARAQLDWDDDVVAFGTEQNETKPILVSIAEERFRAFCLADGQFLRTRRSLVHGEAWESFSDRELLPTSEWIATSDHEYSYVCQVGTTGIFRISHSDAIWQAENEIYVVTDQETVFACDIATDVEFDSDDTFLHGCCLYRSHEGNNVLAYFRSEDLAQSIAEFLPIDSLFQIQDSSGSVSTTMTWSGEDEKIWIAVTKDRPGSTGEQIFLYSSENLGQTWSDPITPDSSSYAQYQPSLIGIGEMIMLAYQRRNSASIARDIFTVYSPDNGITWSEPLQLTDHPFDDIQPQLTLSGGQIGLFYARSQIHEAPGDLLFRSSNIIEPWIWSAEEMVSEPDGYLVTEGYSSAGNADGFSALWSGRVVGDDGDILFDGSWRGTSTNRPNLEPTPRVQMRASATSGWIEYDIPRGQKIIASLYDVLGRTVAQATLIEGAGIWKIPQTVPSGAYWLSYPRGQSIRVNVIK